MIDRFIILGCMCHKIQRKVKEYDCIREHPLVYAVEHALEQGEFQLAFLMNVALGKRHLQDFKDRLESDQILKMLCMFAPTLSN